ncbi:MAG TPA: hypothetical protein DIT04_08755 [Dysgonomonas sp.]|nr:hypothetical protein [Dysgonomonas sp.]
MYAMKIKTPLLCLLISFMFCATSCPDDLLYVQLVDIELYNLDFSGEKMTESSEPIKKEAYVIGIKYLVKHDYEGFGDKTWYYHPDKEYGNSEIITNIKRNPTVLTLSDFNEDYPAGSDISHLFTYGRSDYYEEMSLLLVLNAVPDPGIHSFKVKLPTENNLIIEEIIETTLY